jgi:RNA polymerase sigma-70 factor (ECF subfamily)
VTGTEAQWIEQALQGDDNAFGFLVEAYQKPVFSLCYRMLGNANDADDAAQESFIRAYQHLKKYDQNRSFTTWLLSIASHYCIDQIRKRHLAVVPMEELPAEIILDQRSPLPEHQMHQREKDAFVQKMMNGLKPTDRAAIVLRYWYELSEVEISETLNISVSAVKSRLFRARRSLADAWIANSSKSAMKERKTNESPAF